MHLRETLASASLAFSAEVEPTVDDGGLALRGGGCSAVSPGPMSLAISGPMRVAIGTARQPFFAALRQNQPWKGWCAPPSGLAATLLWTNTPPAK